MTDSFLEKVKVEIVVPQDGTLDLKNRNEKTVLLLDEIVNVFVILHNSADEATIRSQLSRLSINVEAYATGIPRRALDQQQRGYQAPSPPQIRESVAKSIIEPAQESPTLSVSGTTTSVCWSTEIHIDHTRITTTSPSLTFTATISLSSSSPSPSQPEDEEDEYLTPGVPVTSQNLLAALAQSSTFADSPNPPYLPASRLYRGPPSTRQRPLQSRSQIPTIGAISPQFKLQPAVLSRLRTLHLGSAPNLAKVLANVEVEVAGNVEAAEIEDLDVVLEDGRVAPHGQENAGVGFPKTLRKGDVMSLAYTMTSSTDSSYADQKQPKPTASKAGITLIATVKTGQTGSSTPVKIKSHWFAQIDFSRNSSTSRQPTRSEQDTASSLDHLISLTITRQSPHPLPLTPGTRFRWHVLLANRSTTRTLNLAIIPITPTATPTATRDWSATLTAPTTSNVAETSTKSTGRRHADREHRGLSTQDTKLPMWLYASASTHAGDGAARPQASNSSPSNPHGNVADTPNTPYLLTTTPDIRPGPLPPGASTTAEVEFVVLGGTGSGGVEALRVVDLDSAGMEGRERGRWRWVDVGSGMLPGILVVGHEIGEKGTVDVEGGGAVEVGRGEGRAVEVGG